MKTNNVVFLDIDDTFIDENTTFKFINFVVNKFFIKKIYFILITKFPLSLFFKFLFKIKLYDSKYLVLRLLNNFEKNKLNIYADNYINNIYDSTKYNKKILNLLKEYKIKNYNIIILSNTIDIVSNSIMKKFNFDINYSSSLIFKNSFCKGKYSNEINKIEIVKKYKLNKNLKSIIITDNINDYETTKICDYAYIVINKSNKKFWYSNIKNNLNYEFI